MRRQHTQRETLIGLGLNRIGRIRELPDTPSTRGMIAKVAHLVRVVDGKVSRRAGRTMKLNEIADGPARARSASASAAASARARARPAAAAARARPRARACASRASKAARCRCIGGCRSAASNTAFALKLNEINLGRVQKAIEPASSTRGARSTPRRWSRPACCAAPRTACGCSATANSRRRCSFGLRGVEVGRRRGREGGRHGQNLAPKPEAASRANAPA